LQGEIELGPRVAKARQAQLDAAKATHIASHDTLKKLKLKLKDEEGALKTVDTRLLKLQGDINSASSKKEFDAKTSEIEQATVNRGKLEDSILELLTDIEERTADLPNVDQRWADAQAEFATATREAEERLQRLKADQQATQASLEEWEAKLPPEVKSNYARLIKTYGPDGLAGLRGRSCQQCRTTVTEQTRNNVLGGLWVCCPQCGRALYMAESPA
jgi:predicted  nucleic acid-binding Zn-ribbon protein